MVQGFLLGLSNGTTCLASCAPVILPYVLGTGNTIKRNFMELLTFLAGRLVGYICFGILAWFTNQLLLSSPIIRSRFMGIAFLLLSLVLIVYNLTGNRQQCNIKNTMTNLNKIITPDTWYYPFFFGLLTGVNVCPPFLLVFLDATNSGSLIRSILFFTTFFVGTSVFFIPIPFLGVLKNRTELKTVGELALYLVAGYYLIKGIINLGGLM